MAKQVQLWKSDDGGVYVDEAGALSADVEHYRKKLAAVDAATADVATLRAAVAALETRVAALEPRPAASPAPAPPPPASGGAP